MTIIGTELKLIEACCRIDLGSGFTLSLTTLTRIPELRLFHTRNTFAHKLCFGDDESLPVNSRNISKAIEYVNSISSYTRD